jgi:hypothetical protein
MLISASETSESKSILDRPYVGKVVDNNDPLILGRVRCTIEGLINDSDKAPWIMRKSSSFLGGTTESGQFAVPEIGSELTIEFPYNDIYSGEYNGYWNGANTTPSSSAANYPETVVLAQIGTLKVLYTKSTEKLEIDHPSGTKITLKQNGDIELVASKDITLNGNTGMVLTTESDPVVDNITGVPTAGAARVKAGLA